MAIIRAILMASFSHSLICNESAKRRDRETIKDGPPDKHRIQKVARSELWPAVDGIYSST